MRDADRFGKVYHFNNNIPESKRFGFIRLYQIGELQCSPGYEVPRHNQPCAEISYIVSGKGVFECNGKTVPVEAGDLFLNQVADVHAIYSDPREDLRYLYLGFLLDDRLDGDYAALSRFFEALGEVRLVKDRFDVRAPFLRLINEFYTGGTCSQLAIESLLCEVLVLTYRNFRDVPQKAYLPLKASDTAGSAVYSAIRYIEAHASDIGEVREIANALGYSGSYLSHLFRERTGETLQSYLTRKKVEAGIELMKTGRYSVTQIAMRLGYDTLQSFSKAFRRVMDIPPTEYLRRLRTEGDANKSSGGETRSD